MYEQFGMYTFIRFRNNISMYTHEHYFVDCVSNVAVHFLPVEDAPFPVPLLCKFDKDEWYDNDDDLN